MHRLIIITNCKNYLQIHVRTYVCTYIDINECLIENGGCEFSCTNLEGINSTTGVGYQCGCDYGYQLASNNHDCDGAYIYAYTYVRMQVCNYIIHAYIRLCMQIVSLLINIYVCTDIPNCVINDHNCSQICVELEGSFSCFCYPGYELQEDGATCLGKYCYVANYTYFYVYIM